MQYDRGHTRYTKSIEVNRTDRPTGPRRGTSSRHEEYHTPGCLKGLPQLGKQRSNAAPRTLTPVRVGDGLLKMFGLCLLAGVLVAGMLFPVFGALGVASNQASDTIDSVSADLVTTDPPLITQITDSQGKP